MGFALRETVIAAAGCVLMVLAGSPWPVTVSVLLLTVVVYAISNARKALGGQKINVWLLLATAAVIGVIQALVSDSASVYTIAVTSIVVGYVVIAGWDVLCRAKTTDPAVMQPLLAGNGAALVLCLISGAAALIASWPGVAVVLGLVAGSGIRWLGRQWTVLLPGISVAAISVAAVAMLSPVMNTPVNITALITVVLLGIGLSAGLYAGGQLFASADTRLVTPTVLGMALLGAAIHVPDFWKLLAALLIADLVALIVLEIHWYYRSRQSPLSPERVFSPLAAILTALLIFFIAAMAVSPPGQSSFGLLLVINAIFVVTLAKLMVSRIREAWQPMVDAERGGDPAQGPHPDLVRASVRSWVNSTTTGIGMQLSVTLLAYQTIGDSFSFGTQKPVPGELIAVITGVLALAVLGARALRGLFHRQSFARDEMRPKQTAGAWVTGPATVVLIALTLIGVTLAVRTGWHGQASWFVLGPMLVIAADCMYTTLFDSTFMCRRWPDAKDFALSAAAATGQGSLLYWALLSGSAGGGMQLGYALLLYGVVTVARVATTMAAGSIMYGRGTSRYATELPIWWTYLQNDAIRTVMGITLVWFPAFALTHIDAVGWALLSNVLIASVPAIVLTVPVYLFGSQRVIAHAYEQRAKRFGGRYKIDQVPSFDLRIVLVDALEFIVQFYRWRKTANRRQPLDDEGFAYALSANLGGQVWLRAALCAFTVVGFLALLSDGLLSGHPAASHSNGGID